MESVYINDHYDKPKPKEVNISALDCYLKAIECGHNDDLETNILHGGNPFVSYLYARDIKGANISKHMKFINGSNMEAGEKKYLLNELQSLKNQQSL